MPFKSSYYLGVRAGYAQYSAGPNLQPGFAIVYFTALYGVLAPIPARTGSGGPGASAKSVTGFFKEF